MKIIHLVETYEKDKVRLEDTVETITVIRHTECNSKEDALDFVREGPYGTILSLRYLGPAIKGHVSFISKKDVQRPRKKLKKVKKNTCTKETKNYLA